MEIDAYDARDVDGVVALCADEGWTTYVADPARTHRVLTAAGVTTIVARDADRVVGFASIQSDGEIQAHLSLIAVAASHRRRGIATALLQRAIAEAGGERIDLITDEAPDFYASLRHQRWPGFRIYPPFTGSG